MDDGILGYFCPTVQWMKRVQWVQSSTYQIASDPCPALAKVPCFPFFQCHMSLSWGSSTACARQFPKPPFPSPHAIASPEFSHPSAQPIQGIFHFY